MLRLIQGIFICISIVRGKIPKAFPPLKKKNGSGIAQSDFENAEEFNGLFTDVFTKTVHNQVPLLDRSAPFMDEIVVTKEGVSKLLKCLNPSKALGLPLFKNGDRSLACNYRPVSLTCIPCKLLEHIICSNITGHRDQDNLLSDK